MADKIRIIDIAERAGVSAGTVDRVLHDRPNVSLAAREKVEKALKEMNYQPNAYASALAYNRSYTFYMVLPSHGSEAYWEDIEKGALKAKDQRSDFQIDVKFLYYERFNPESFNETSIECLRNNPDGVVLVPSSLDTTRNFTDKLHQRNISFILLDSFMPDLKPLSFYGQDSFQSGYFAAKMLMLIAHDEKEIMLMKQTNNGTVASKQQANREVGFRHYMKDHFPDVKIVEIDLESDSDRKHYDSKLEKFFTSHPSVHHCITLTSRAYIVGDFLLKTNRRDIQIMGYDVVDKNKKDLKAGAISFLIAQHAFQQGFSCIDTLFRAIVLKKKVQPINYMPIELLSKENIDFYHRMPI